ncbi:MAG: helix-turn-helix transcriptional regulator [Azonexus sp.]|jgi:molybdate transport repressor ModE-like protein|nr:helix-turn-helix transcriptional regulator [Azonexus sp.]
MPKTATSLPRLRWNWDFGIDLSDLDTRRLLALLSALLDTRALAAAAASAGMSYRAAWGLLHTAEQRLGLKLAVMARGRGTHLTAFGEALVGMDAAARQALGEAHAHWEERMQDVLATPPTGAHADRCRRPRLYASHDLALADWAEHGRRVPVEITWRGSENALAALGRGECDIAGFHAPEHWSPAQLATWLGQWLKPRLHRCLPVMRRQVGLLVASGNPLALTSLADVSERRLRLVNRQRGSGTRRLLDQLLAANGIAGERIDGYAHEEFTHDAVAATVASGAADAGFGILAAARRYDLDFLPMLWERYGFALCRPTLEDSAGAAFLRRLGGATFRQRLLALPGYQPLDGPTDGSWAQFLAPADK